MYTPRTTKEQFDEIYSMMWNGNWTSAAQRAAEYRFNAQEILYHLDEMNEEFGEIDHEIYARWMTLLQMICSIYSETHFV
tara:strand:- start:220 stop:459 length:240 start_codon:yes stop_codon:yes gene_type:complete